MPAIDDLEVIRELLTVGPPSREAGDHVQGRLAAVIAAESDSGGRRAGGRRARSRRTMVMMAAGVALAAAVTVVAVMVPGTSRPQAHAGRPGVIQLLVKIATTAGRQPVPHVRNSQFEYIKSWVTGYELTPAARQGRDQTQWHIQRARPSERQIWIPVSDLCRPGLLREGGNAVRTAVPVTAPHSGKSTPSPAGACPDHGTLNDPTYRLLQALPTSPAVLLQRIRAFDNTQAGRPLQGTQANAAAFSTVSELVGESIVPPAVAAALYRAVALIPGVQMTPDAVDARGRRGVGVNLPAATAWGPTEMIFDQKTLQLIGTFTIQPPPGSWTGHNSLPHGHALPATFTAIQARAFVSHPGQLPAQ